MKKDSSLNAIQAILKSLTHEDLREWAGSKIYNRGKEYVTEVSQLSCTEDGTLVAWVTGTEEYATTIRQESEGEFDYDCTCPYDYFGPCKHAVALVLAAAEYLKRGEDIPLLDLDDDLYFEAFEDQDDVCFEDEYEFSEDDPSHRLSKAKSSQIKAMLASKTRDELEVLLVTLTIDFPEVSRRLQDTMRLETGKIDQLVRSLRKEIRRLTSEDAWYNPWKGEGNLPEYLHVQEQLEAMLAKGHGDAVVELGEELWKRGVGQVEESHDEGESASAIGSCLDVVLRALPSTSMAPAKQLLWRIEHELEDEYNLLEGADEVLTDLHYTQAHWCEVASILEKRLAKMKVAKSGQFSETYKRKRVMDWLCKAYTCSGEEHKIIPLLEREADRCQCYDALVNVLLEAGENEKARQWCIRGFERTIKDAPGIASQLQTHLRELAEAEKRFDLAAAYRAENFFEWPSEKSYEELRRATEKVKAWPAVREGILAYLQTGRRPDSADNGKNIWPLPAPEVSEPQAHLKFRMKDFPDSEMLIEIALLEKRFDDAVAIYHDLRETRRWGWGIDEQLAKAVATSHPDVSLQIWQSIAEKLIGQVKPKSYQEAAKYLRHMRKVYDKTGRITEWTSLLKRLRTQHKAKRRLLEVLDDLEDNRKLMG